ncbi:MAG: class I SAM-dependent methyltransferase, partial [Wenzhouxiangellaceae bacterium]
LTDRIELHRARLPEHGLTPHSFDAVVSNSLLHHLPDPTILWHSIRELARPGAWVQVMDLARPDNADTVARLVDLYAAGEPDLLRRDFSNSLHAAWRVEEINDQLAEAGLRLQCRQISDRHWQVAGFLDTGH